MPECTLYNMHQCARVQLFHEEIILKVELLDQKISKHVRIFNIHYQFPYREFMAIYTPLSNI